MEQQTDVVQGVLQSLLQRASPERRAGLEQVRDQAQGRHLQAMQTPLTQSGPVQRSINNYLQRMGADPRKGLWNMAGALGEEASRADELQNMQLLRQEKAAAQEAKYAGDALSEIDELQIAAVGSRGGLSRQPSPEQLRTLTASIRNEAAQAAKGYDWAAVAAQAGISPADAREQWITEYTDRGLNHFLQNFAIQPVGPRGMQQSVQSPTRLQELPQVPAQQSAPSALPVQQAPGELAPTTSQQNAQRNLMLLQQEMARPDVQASPDRLMILRQELQRAQDALQGVPAQQQPVAMPGSQARGAQQPPTAPQQTSPANAADRIQPVRRNEAAEAAQKKGAEAMASAYVEDYQTVQAAALSAAQQLEAFDALSKIKPNTGLFANAEQTVGALFSALGQDPSDPIIQNAMKTRNAEQVINRLTNAALRTEKGVQTKTDEVRIYKEFPKTTDFQQVWDFNIKLGRERSLRRLAQRDFFDEVANANNGVPVAARQQWDKQMAGDPITQYLGGKLIFRSEFLDAYARKYPELGPQAAIQKWREMEQDYNSRGGRK